MLVDVERRLIRLKIVYYGVAQSGKTTNLEKLSEIEGLNLMKIDTQEEKTLVFDFTTKKVTVGNMTISFALYTVPGQDIYKDIRLTVLRGVDGLVFVVDSQRERLKENINFYSLLKADLLRIGKGIGDVPLVFQYNKMDLPNTMSYEELERFVNTEKYPSVCASAIRGEGVLETFKVLEDYLISRVERMLL
ncbi:MAG: ADP-ribosylation factor-like protein [Aquificaceae bacterium]|nr:ADP-ribosylation factor-like protein [Aquificaceae bacterium]MDW8423332.1 ADP-ribosylation factor-like protein [Aquificaceae bacterium]